MILEVITVIAVVVFICTISNIFMNVRNQKPKDKMSFRETMDLCQLPLITFVNNKVKLNFLLDTGASLSIIDSNVLANLNYTKLDKVGDIYGMEGNRQDTSFILMSLNYKDKIYEDEFQVMDMSSPFGNLKADFGVNVHGVLSSTFFQKYQYVLDFKELVAYSNV